MPRTREQILTTLHKEYQELERLHSYQLSSSRYPGEGTESIPNHVRALNRYAHNRRADFYGRLISHRLEREFFLSVARTNDLSLQDCIHALQIIDSTFLKNSSERQELVRIYEFYQAETTGSAQGAANHFVITESDSPAITVIKKRLQLQLELRRAYVERAQALKKPEDLQRIDDRITAYHAGLMTLDILLIEQHQHPSRDLPGSISIEGAERQEEQKGADPYTCLAVPEFTTQLLKQGVETVMRNIETENNERYTSNSGSVRLKMLQDLMRFLEGCEVKKSPNLLQRRAYKERVQALKNRMKDHIAQNQPELTMQLLKQQFDTIQEGVEQLIDNIKNGKNGRYSWSNGSEKLKMLQGVNVFLKACENKGDLNLQDILGLIKSICAEKRHSFNIFSSEPHSLGEFNTIFADYTINELKTAKIDKEQRAWLLEDPSNTAKGIQSIPSGEFLNLLSNP